MLPLEIMMEIYSKSGPREKIILSNYFYRGNIKFDDVIQIPVQYLGIVDDAVLKLFPNLTYLDASGNKNITDDSIIKLRNLKYLNASGNRKITDRSISKLSKLTHLDASNNLNITDESVSKLVNLMYLNAANSHNITDESVSKLNKLTHLNASNNQNITDYFIYNIEATEQTAEFLDGVLDHTENNVDFGLEQYVHDCSRNRNIRINRHNMFLLSRSMDIPYNLIPRKNIALTYLNASHNPNITDKSILKLTNLTHLNASHNENITDKSIVTLINLVYLDASHNEKITDKSVSKLINLSSLNASNNQEITNTSVVLLVNLTDLDVSYNKNITNCSVYLLNKLRYLKLDGDSNINTNKLNKNIAIYTYSTPSLMTKLRRLFDFHW